VDAVMAENVLTVMDLKSCLEDFKKVSHVVIDYHIVITVAYVA